MIDVVIVNKVNMKNNSGYSSTVSYLIFRAEAYLRSCQPLREK